ncbi:MAG: DUF1365 domain-containing protein [Rheinheimera sp.]|mgnify:FL=1|uniref:DUF1365 domain-containing protein n=1 Tax=Arsukibacterium sp. UBA3155 TaxID=1946058 RepID=UPI000C8EF877|nr:DUF1365 domain-containing protein [Arsukibacterium sp. UBA3155]MAD76843.1 DUF1365 domain-containing protein [Rheinheimera sp.]|tara:strand:- start:26836 stop:27588 length:753 start_codon:yes stop_codon:yes gene_type:complete
MQAGHAVYCGVVGHKRFIPKPHGFHYTYHAYWLDCEALSTESLSQVGINYEVFGAISYRRRDYLPGNNTLSAAVQNKVRELGGVKPVVSVYLLTPLANWGYYFSPITLYYCYDSDGAFCYLLAEVSNTPWNERHYYLQKIDSQSSDPGFYQHDKAFHVSPFNPMDMQYRWQIPAPASELYCSITNIKAQQAVFSAWIKLKRVTLNNANRRRILIRHPWQNVQVMWRIYWQALKLFVKRVPLHQHPKSREK